MFEDKFKAKMTDGSRHFVDLPIEFAFFDELYEHTEKLPGVEIGEFLVDGIVSMWLEFTFRGHKFTVNNQFTDYWFFVEDAECPEEILLEIADHYRQLTEQ